MLFQLVGYLLWQPLRHSTLPITFTSQFVPFVSTLLYILNGL
jgi:hypothetical protein